MNLDKQGLQGLVAVERAIDFIKTLSDSDMENLILGLSEFKLISKVENLGVVNKNDDGEGKNNKSRGAIKKPYDEGRGFTQESKSSTKKNKREDKKEERYTQQIEERVEDEENEFDVYIRELSRFKTVEEATEYLIQNKLTVTKLKILAKKLSLYIKSKVKKSDIIELIVDGVVGSRIRIESLRKY